MLIATEHGQSQHFRVENKLYLELELLTGNEIRRVKFLYFGNLGIEGSELVHGQTLMLIIKVCEECYSSALRVPGVSLISVLHFYHRASNRKLIFLFPEMRNMKHQLCWGHI